MTLTNPNRLIVNAILFQVQWFICVQANNIAALIGFIVLMLAHKHFLKPDHKEVVMIIIFTLIGVVVESVASTIGLIQFNGQTYSNIANHQVAIAPIWLILLWSTFATTLRHCLSWLYKKPFITVLLIIIFIPVNYLIGARLSGSIIQGKALYFLTYEVIVWLLVLPLTIRLLNHKKRNI